jgi:outer membrane cobalamin receptor
LALAVGATTVAWPAAARGDDTGDLQGLLSETYASKTTESTSTAPAISTTLTSDDIRRYGIHSLDEAIDFLSLGAFTSSNLGNTDIGANGVIIPGDQGEHILLLINGHAMNEALYGAARFNRGAGIPMEMVDHIEVILGPGSVLYGSSAMLGVVNVVTKDARGFAGTHVVAESELLTSWRIAGGGGYEFPLFGQPAKLAMELEYYQDDGPTFTFADENYGTNAYTNKPYAFGPTGATGIWGGPANKSYYSRVPSGLLTFRLGDVEVAVHASLYKRASPYNADFISPEADFNDPNNYAIDRSASADIKHRWSISAVAELRSRLYADAFDTYRYADSSALGPYDCAFDVVTCRQRAFGASRWVGLEEQATFDWLKDSTLVTLLGVDDRVRNIAAQTDVFDAANGQPLATTQGVLRASDDVFAAYGQQTWQPVTWLGLNGGARFDYDQRFGAHVSPRAAVSAETWRGGTFKVIYSDAFRAPSWEESNVAVDNQIPAGRLRPETVNSFTFAFDQRLGSNRIQFGVFRAWWNNMVELHTLTSAEITEQQQAHELSVLALSATQYRNVSSIDSYGFNSSYEGAFGQSRLRYALNVTASTAATEQGNEVYLPIVLAPQVYGNARVSYALPGDLPTLAVAARYLGTRPVNLAYGNGFVPTPYATPLGDLRGTVAGPFPWIRGLLYRASADYSPTAYGAYVVGPFQRGPAAAATGTGRTPPAVPYLNPIDRFRATVGLQYEF